MEGIALSTDLTGLEEHHLQGFFVGWPTPPSAKAHLQQLNNSTIAILAREQGTENVVGFITVLTDGTLFAYISALEVLPNYQGAGIGKALVEAALYLVSNIYAIDLVCDPDVQPFYKKFGLTPYHSMVARRRENIG